MPFRHEDVAVRRDEHVVGLKEEFRIATAARLPSVISSLPSG
jgi:hypothetical protein